MGYNSIVYRLLLTCVATLWAAGCSSADISVDVECDNDDVREIACGVKNNGVQKQLSVEYQWTDDGICDDPTECLGRETRSGASSCGLNGRGVVREQCDAGVWKSLDQIASHNCSSDEDPQRCACNDPDECMDGETVMDACGIEDSGEQALLCTDGQWVADSQCEGAYKCAPAAEMHETNACGLNGRGTQLSVCSEGGVWEPTECEDSDVCTDGETAEFNCTSTGANGLPQVQYSVCELGQWGDRTECQDSGCTPWDDDLNTCGTEQNMSGEEYRLCNEEGEWISSGCRQKARSIYEAPYGYLLYSVANDMLTVGDNEFKTAGTGELLGNEMHKHPVKTLAVDPQAQRQRFSASISHQCGVNDIGRVYCWGDNEYGQLGANAPQEESADPQLVSLESKSARAVSVGEGFSCALTTDGGVYCWGLNDQQQLGRNDVDLESSQTPVKVFDGAKAIAAGGAHVCALRDKDVYCWGANDAQQAAESEDQTINLPTRHATLSRDPGSDQAPPNRESCAPTLDQSESHGLAAGRKHTLVSWRAVWRRPPAGVLGGCGSLLGEVTHRTIIHVIGVGNNAHGQLGKPTSAPISSPTSLQRDQFSSVADVQFVPRANGNVSCVLRQQGIEVTDYRCTGDNSEGQLSDTEGDVTQLTPLPSDLGNGEGIVGLAIGFDSLCVLLSDTRRIRCRGGNDRGQLGDGTTESRRVSDFMLHEVMGENP